MVSSVPIRPIEYNKKQKSVALVFYSIIVLASLITIGGAVLTLAEIFIGYTGKLEMFLALNPGFQIAIIGGLLAGLFFLLVFFFGLFKKTSRSLINFIYKVRELEEKYKNRIGVKIAAGGLLISLIGIIIGIIFAIVVDFLTGSEDGAFSLIGILNTWGPAILASGIGLFLLVGIVLFMIYFWKNGYYIILKIMGALEKEEKK
ncbi:MAG: hypothetical protein ACFFAQ_10675 [Promethearchaeota archaeon]